MGFFSSSILQLGFANRESVRITFDSVVEYWCDVYFGDSWTIVLWTHFELIKVLDSLGNKC